MGNFVGRSEAHDGVEHNVPPVDDVDTIVAAVGEAGVFAAAERAVMALVARQSHVKDRHQPDFCARGAALLEHRDNMLPEPKFANCGRLARRPRRHARQALRGEFTGSEERHACLLGMLSVQGRLCKNCCAGDSKVCPFYSSVTFIEQCMLYMEHMMPKGWIKRLPIQSNRCREWHDLGHQKRVIMFQPYALTGMIPAEKLANTHSHMQTS